MWSTAAAQNPVSVSCADVVGAREDAAGQLGMHGNPTADVVDSTPVAVLGQSTNLTARGIPAIRRPRCYSPALHSAADLSSPFWPRIVFLSRLSGLQAFVFAQAAVFASSEKSGGKQASGWPINSTLLRSRLAWASAPVLSRSLTFSHHPSVPRAAHHSLPSTQGCSSDSATATLAIPGHSLCYCARTELPSFCSQPGRFAFRWTLPGLQHTLLLGRITSSRSTIGEGRALCFQSAKRDYPARIC